MYVCGNYQLKRGTMMTKNETRELNNAILAKMNPVEDESKRLLNRQAESLRKALLAQKAALNAQTAPADETLYQKILFRLKREGLIKENEMTTKHTCNEGRGPVFGRKLAGCPRCDELLAGAPAVIWSGSRKAECERSLLAAIRAHRCSVSRCGPVCTAFDY
jgi:hypothetical protein